MKTIAIIAQKGGSGKTTFAVYRAVVAERAGDGPCVLIDTGPQASLADQRTDTRPIQDYLGHRYIHHTVIYTATNAARFETLWR
jgi:cellulose biosynthesis protein BcsQ